MINIARSRGRSNVNQARNIIILTLFDLNVSVLSRVNDFHRFWKKEFETFLTQSAYLICYIVLQSWLIKTCLVSSENATIDMI